MDDASGRAASSDNNAGWTGGISGGQSPEGGTSTGNLAPSGGAKLQTDNDTAITDSYSTGGTLTRGGAASTGGNLASGGGFLAVGTIPNHGGTPSVGGAQGSGGALSASGAPAQGGVSSSGSRASDTPTGGASAGSTATKGGAASGETPKPEGGLTGTCAGSCSNAATGSCSSPQVRITSVSLGSPLSYSTDETGVMPLAIAAKPGGGSRLAWTTGYSANGSSKNSALHVAELDCNDQLVGTPFTLEAHDFQDLAADGEGGVVLLTRDAQGGGTLNCGSPSNLCGTPPNPPVGCYDMYMVRYDCAGAERWATKLTTASATLPPYSTGPTGPNVQMIWWYQHQGRLAFDGSNYAAYFSSAISVSQNGCINIHEGDRMQVLSSTGSLLTGHDSIDWGCSHSGFTRIVWDPSTRHFVMTCKTDNSNRIAQPNGMTTVYPVTLDGSYVGDLVLAPGGGYWITVSNSGSVHLLHFQAGAQADQDKTLASANYPHLVAYGANRMIVAWASSATGNMTAQVFDPGGSQVSSAFSIDVPGHPYQSFRAFPDGSAAYAAVGAASSTIQIARILPCSG